MKIQIDMAELTLGDMEDFETHAGLPMSSLAGFTDEDGNASGMPTKALTALIFVAKRSEDRRFTIEDARKLKLNDLDFEIVDSAANPPNEDG